MKNIENLREVDNTAKDDRVLVMKPKEGESVKSTGGQFQGGNQLHAVFEGHTCLWYLKFEKGALPGALKDKRYTSFKKAVQAAENYFGRRGLEIVKIEE